MAIFEHLSDEEVNKYYNQFIKQGMSEDAALDEIFCIDCNMDMDEGEDE